MENNLLSKEEIKQVNELMRLKRDIMSYIDMDLFIEQSKELIDNSNIFEFRSKISRLYIDKNKPSFILKIKNEDIYNDLLTMDDKMAVDQVNHLLNSEIIVKLSELLSKAIKSKNNNELFKDIPEELSKFILSNIYIIRTNIKDNNVQLFFFN